MPKGISIHIGLNRVDPNHYAGWDGALVACEADARDMKRLATSLGYDATMLLTRQATANAVKDAISGAARRLSPGDILFLTYSGHGGQVPDLHREEPDARDETWVLYDRELIDDELYSLWSEFKPGVRIAVLADSCHSGSSTRGAVIRRINSDPALTRDFNVTRTGRFRALPESLENQVYAQNQPLYDQVQRSYPAGDSVAVEATVLLISGCQDNQLSQDGDDNGLFTATLLRVWNQGRFSGGYSHFHKKIGEQMPPWQSPNFFTVGAQNPQFLGEKPFKI
jgi:hypothetical protein